jgi:hypothetical protein
MSQTASQHPKTPSPPTHQITALSKRLRAQLPLQKINDLIIRDLSEAMQLTLPGFAARSDAARRGGSGAAAAALPGRLSGPAAWRAARGEAGAGAAGAAAAGGSGRPVAPPAGTRYELSGTGAPQLAELHRAAGRLFSVAGGACRASGQHGQNEAPGRLFNGELSSKWLDFGGGGVGGQAWVEWRLPAAAAPEAAAHYCLASGGDCPERDPAHIVLECIPASSTADCAPSSDGTSQGVGPGPAASSSGSGTGAAAAEDEWRTLDERRGVKFSARGQLLSFTVPEASREILSRRWRLRVLAVADPAAANSVQLALWDVYANGSSSSGGGAAAAATVATSGSGGDCAKAGAAGGGASGLPYWSAAVESELRDLASSSAAAARTAAAADTGAATSADGDPSAAVTLLRRIAANMLNDPPDPRHHQLRGDKVAALTRRPACLAALLAMGFRPAVLPPRATGGSGGGGAGDTTGLLADYSTDSGSDGRAGARRAAAAVLGALGGGSGGCET